MKTERIVWLMVFVAVFSVIGIVAIWYYGENYQGAHAWSEARRKMEASGQPLDAARFIPPPVPDDQNLAMAPFFVSFFGYRVDPETGVLTFSPTLPDNKQIAYSMPFGAHDDYNVNKTTLLDWTTAHPVDLGIFQTYYASQKDFPHPPAAQSSADDVLLALQRYAPALDEIAQAAAIRPLARFPINWTQSSFRSISFTHLYFFTKVIQTLRLRACASLALGKSDDALHDLALGFRLLRIPASEPALVSTSVYARYLRLLLQPIWEGLAARRWSESQLAELMTHLQEINLLRQFRGAVQSDRAMFTIPLREKYRGPGGAKKLFAALFNNDFEQPVQTAVTKIPYPAGWIDLSVAYACQEEQAIIDAVEVDAHRMLASRIDAGQAALTAAEASPTTFVAKLTLPGFYYQAAECAWMQAAVDEAVTACALERFFLAHGSYPARLDDLVPAGLPAVPNDVIDGAPLRYETTPTDGRYRLWEVGWNGRDEGGVVGWSSDGKRMNKKEGDWVWQYQPLSPAGTVKP